jgi:FhuF 2Fe-2S C-terminal domain
MTLAVPGPAGAPEPRYTIRGAHPNGGSCAREGRARDAGQMQPGERRDVAALLAAVAEVGPFFAVAHGAEPADGGWVPVRALGGEPGRHDPLGDRIAAVRAALATDARVAASTVSLGLAAQLVAPLFAAVAVHGALPVPDPGGAGIRPTTGRDDPAADALADVLHWRPGGTGPWLWWSGGGRVVAGGPTALADVVTALLAPPVAAVRARVPIAERVLWGNVASAVASARQLVAAAAPESAGRAGAVAEHLLTTPPLAPTAELRDPEPPDVGWSFRRRTCCLYYRVPGGGLCGDCVLLDRP